MKTARNRGTVTDGGLRLLILAVVAVVVGCNRRASLPPAPTNLADQIQLTCDGEAWDAYGNFLPVLRLINRSPRDISYPGYSTSSPVYVQQVRSPDSEGWRDENPGWCGVGLGRQQLRAGQSAAFSVVPPEAAQPWRIGIKIERPEPRVIWTEPITASTGTAREAPSAIELVQTSVVRHPDREFPYTFTLKNVSGRSLYYGGFKEPHVPPIYLNQEERAEGWQGDGQANWSGTDFGFKELPPGGSISFSIPAQSLDSTWRIGVRLFKTARPARHDDAYSPVWWAPLPPRNQV